MFISRINAGNIVSEYEFRMAKYAEDNWQNYSRDDARSDVIAAIMWDTAGPNNAGIRQELMRLFTGKKIPQAKCGVNALIRAAHGAMLFPLPELSESVVGK